MASCRDPDHGGRRCRDRRRHRVLATALAAGLVVAGCASAPPPPAPPADPACTAFVRYGDLSGTSVSIAEIEIETGIETGAQPRAGSEPGAGSKPGAGSGRRVGGLAAFARCTGARIEHRAEPALAERLRVGEPPPDLGYLPDAAALTELVRQTGAVRPVPPPVAANVAEFYPETYEAAGSVGGTLYAAPLDGSVKSLVWYSPRMFAGRGYRIPADWGELLALSQRIVADGGTPWCAGVAAGPATGWPLVDALEDAVLGTAGPEVFDAWVGHAIPSNAPQIAAALDELGVIARNGTFVNGLGDPASSTTTSVADGGVPITTGRCFLHRQADRYATAWPAGTDIGPDGDVFAFRLPPRRPGAEPTALVGGGFVVAFTDRREVAALQAYLSTPDAAGEMARELGPGWVSPSSGLDPDALDSPLDRLALGVLQDPRTTLRYDGSDRMPAEVGSGSLPRALAAWVSGASTAEALAAAEAGWPR
jgi:alpha-glucoside transport system substrate-binding protein